MIGLTTESRFAVPAKPHHELPIQVPRLQALAHFKLDALPLEQGGVGRPTIREKREENA